MRKLSALLFCVALASPIGGCKGKNHDNKLKTVSPATETKQPKTRIATDPAEQMLMLQEAIRLREKKLETAPAEEADKINAELAILRDNLKRVRAKFNQTENR